MPVRAQRVVPDLSKACRKRCGCGEQCCKSPHCYSHRYICRTRRVWKMHIATGAWNSEERRPVVAEYLDHCQRPDPEAVLNWIAAGRPEQSLRAG